MRQRPITTAILQALTDAGIPAGDGREPDGAGWTGDAKLKVHDPYVVLYPISGGTRSGLLEDDQGGWSEDAGEYVYQATCVAPSQEAAEELLDDVGEVFASLRGVETGGLRVNLVRNDFGSHLVRRTDDVEPSEPVLFHGTPRYRLWVVKTNGGS